jgi:ribonuclease HII
MTDTAPLTFEQPFWRSGKLVVGIDEVGRGALAGPVTVGAVVLQRDSWLDGVRDSKTLSGPRRDVLAAHIHQQALAVGVGDASAEEIDAVGLTAALQLAATRALAAIGGTYDAVLLDGHHDFVQAEAPTTLVVKGDQASQSIAAASIVAKVHRDRFMTLMAPTYPHYGFEGHKGYGSQAHREAISLHGVCPLHRRSFAPCSGHEQLTLLGTNDRQQVPGQDRR